MSFNKAKYLKSAEKYVQQGKVAAAIEEYRKIVEADPNDLTMINTLGDLCVRAGRTEEAIQNFSRIAENYRENGFTLKAIAMYKKISKLEPTNYETSLKLADLYAKQGLIVDARQQYLIVADAYKKQGQSKRALETLKKIADLDPENTAVRMKLGENYYLEGLYTEAQDAYTSAGQESVRKHRLDEALEAFQRVLQINSESKVALKGIADVYIQQNDLPRALNLLQQTLEKNPGDTDLIVVLGRTYLTANMHHEAEETFSRLLDLDKSRYDYLLEVGRRFLDAGQFEKVIGVVDRCIDLLIARRQEEKALSLLKGILDYDANNLLTLKRLADVYTRVREDHNLANTLNMIVDAALRRQDKQEAINALKRLVEVEPDEPSHRQRLASLGGTDPLGQATVIPASFTMDKKSPPGAATQKTLAAEMTAAEKQLREAEMFATRGYTDQAVDLLEELLQTYPNYLDARQKLKQLYVEGGLKDRAAKQCLELAKIYEATGEILAANNLKNEAYELNPALNPAKQQFNSSSSRPVPAAAPPSAVAPPPIIMPPPAAPTRPPAFTPPPPPMDGAIEIDLNTSFNETSLDPGLYRPPAPSPANVAPNYTSPFAIQPPPGGNDFGNLPADFFGQGGFGTPAPPAASAPPPSAPQPPPPSFESLFFNEPPKTAPPPAAPIFKGSSGDSVNRSFEVNFEEPVPSTQLAKEKVLRDELDGVDFYLTQGYTDIARDTLENLARQYPNNAAIEERFLKLGIVRDKLNTPTPISDIYIEPIEDTTPVPDLPNAAIMPGGGFAGLPATAPLNSFSAPAPPMASAPAAPSFFDSLVSDVEQVLDGVATDVPNVPPRTEAARASGNLGATSGLGANSIIDEELVSIFSEFKNDLEQGEQPDFETHYNLGLAYKDMELYDEAIEEFQVACKATSPGSGDGSYFNCCNMLGFCFLSNNMPRPAASWYKRGIESPGRSEEEYQAMRYDLALAYEELGEWEKALECFHEVYALDINYRNVGTKIRETQERLKGN